MWECLDADDEDTVVLPLEGDVENNGENADSMRGVKNNEEDAEEDDVVFEDAVDDLSSSA